MAFTDFKNDRNKIKLTESDEKVLRLYALDEDLSIGALVSLILNEKVGKQIPSQYVEDLKLRNYISENNTITKLGSEYMNSDSTKERVKKLIEQ